jgi:hypothetical protein
MGRDRVALKRIDACEQSCSGIKAECTSGPVMSRSSGLAVSLNNSYFVAMAAKSNE